LDCSKDKEKLKLDRREAKKLRNKIVGTGNTADSHGSKFGLMGGSHSRGNYNTNQSEGKGKGKVRFVCFFIIL
jgi:hypothetical protein